MKYEFPKNFYWGSATSAHQVEGHNHNDWSKWEKENAKKLAKEASDRWEDWQKEKFPEMLKANNYISGRSCDHYNRFSKDFDILKSLGQNAYRFSIEWSRIEPKEGKFDEKAINHYKKLIKELKEKEIEPFVTLWHFTNPLWFSKKGGWLSKDSPELFARYVDKVAQLFEDVKFWITLNEPIVYISHAYLRGAWPPLKKNIFSSFKVIEHMAKAHKLAYKSLHSAFADCRVGVAKNDVYFKSNFIAHYFDDSYFTNRIKHSQDFLAINYYFYFSVFKKKYLSLSDLGWQIYPQGIYHILKNAKKYNKPIYITENGIADVDDKNREKFIKDHLYWVHKAISEGVDIQGYFYWSLLDNFEWDKGFWPRFGLVDINYKTLERKIRHSAKEYSKICKSNTLEYDK
jgi:beta-glucosidase